MDRGQLADRGQKAANHQQLLDCGQLVDHGQLVNLSAAPPLPDSHALTIPDLSLRHEFRPGSQAAQQPTLSTAGMCSLCSKSRHTGA